MLAWLKGSTEFRRYRCAFRIAEKLTIRALVISRLSSELLTSGCACERFDEAFAQQFKLDLDIKERYRSGETTRLLHRGPDIP